MKIILASQSPRRKEILAEIGLQFDVIPSHSKEYFDPLLPLEEAIQQVAYQKAADIHLKYPDAIHGDWCRYHCQFSKKDLW